jgi:hypothetical protein
MRKQAELHRIAERVIAYVNREVEESGREINVFTHAGVAHALKLEPKQVEAILQEVEHGGSGITVVKRDL